MSKSRAMRMDWSGPRSTPPPTRSGPSFISKQGIYFWINTPTANLRFAVIRKLFAVAVRRNAKSRAMTTGSWSRLSQIFRRSNSMFRFSLCAVGLVLSLVASPVLGQTTENANSEKKAEPDLVKALTPHLLRKAELLIEYGLDHPKVKESDLVMDEIKAIHKKLLASGTSDPKKSPEQPKKGHEKLPPLETLVAEMLKTHPDIRVAEAKLRLATAALESERRTLIAKLGILYADIHAAEASADEGEIRLKRALVLFHKGALNKEELSSAEVTATKLRAEVDVARAKLKLFVGQPGSAIDPALDAIAADRIRALDAARAFPNSEALRKALDEPVKINLTNLSTGDAIHSVSAKLPKFNFVIRVKKHIEKGPDAITGDLLPLGAIVQFVEETHRVVFVLRDYGILV